MTPAAPVDPGVESNLTLDAFLGDRIECWQPRQGFRAGLDTVLLAASISKSVTSLLDLGAGAGIASCCALADLPQAQATLVEREPEMLALAQRNLAHNGFTFRSSLLELDVTARGKTRTKAGLQTDCFGTVIANPPFFDQDRGTKASVVTRAGARHMGHDQLDKWVKTAAAAAAPQGEVIFIHTMVALPDLLASFAARFGAICILPVASRSDRDATRVMIRGIKGSRAPIRHLPPLVLHGSTGNGFLSEVDAIFRGRARLHW